jgi:hypothetical protein
MSTWPNIDVLWCKHWHTVQTDVTVHGEATHLVLRRTELLGLQHQTLKTVG